MKACSVEKERKHRTPRPSKRAGALLRRRGKDILAVIIVSLIIGAVAYSFLSPKGYTVDTTPKIAVVDQLSAQWPDPAFNQTIFSILNQTGLQVDYYPSQDVTVNFYRTLALHDYKLIIFRVHSTSETGSTDLPPWVVFFTSENYSNTNYVSEQEDMRLVYVKFPDVSQLYFGITPTFVQNSMEGTFNGTTIIAMGCEGLNKTTMADAFIQKGAKAFISFNGPVQEEYTDNATVYLLRHLITENQTIQDAVQETMNDVGADPEYKSVLLYYPNNAGTNFLRLNATPTVTTPMVTTARRISKKNVGNSETTFVPSILTS